MDDLRTTIVEAAATVAACSPKTTLISIEDCRDGVSGQPVQDKSGKQVYWLILTGPDAAENWRLYHKGEVSPTSKAVLAIFTEIHKRFSRLHAGEFTGRVINCAEVVK